MQSEVHRNGKAKEFWQVPNDDLRLGCRTAALIIWKNVPMPTRKKTIDAKKHLVRLPVKLTTDSALPLSVSLSWSNTSLLQDNAILSLGTFVNQKIENLREIHEIK